jgi:hypothetical protein
MKDKQNVKHSILKSTKFTHNPATNKTSVGLSIKRRKKMLEESEHYMDEDMKEKLYKRGGKVTHADLLVYHKRA